MSQLAEQPMDIDASGSPTVVETLAAHACAISHEQAPLEVQRKVHNCLLHALVVAAGAGETDFPAIVRRVVGESLAPAAGPARASTVLLGAGHAPAATAAWANAVLLHSRVQEDTHDTVHPGVVVIPAALALAEREESRGSELLDALLRGYETAVALSAVLNARVTPPLRATGAFGPIAAAVAGASVLGLDVEATGRAVALAAAMAGGTTESFAAGTQEWHFQAGQAAQTGVLAADLARAGVPASRQAFEGPGGYLSAYAGGVTDDDVGAVTHRLASRWGINEVTFKPYPVCAFNQAPAAAAVRLAQELAGRSVESVTVRMSRQEARYPGVDNAAPIRSAEQAIMSVQCAVAAALLDENVAFRRLRAAETEEMRSLISKVHVVADDSLPNKRAIVSAKLASGENLSVQSPDMDADLRWESAEVVANARRLLPETSLSEEGLERLRSAIAALAHADDLGTLVDVLP
jgi:2-methylcitrate dehydratase PrpD